MAIAIDRAERTLPYLRAVMLAMILLVARCLPASADTACGAAPSQVPLMSQEQLKGDAEGKAQILTKIIPGAQIKGAVDMSRKELYQEHQNIDQYQIDMYFMWVSCQTINSDTSLATADKIKLWTEVRSAFQLPSAHDTTPQRDPNTLYQYDEIVGEVQGAVVSQPNSVVTFQVVRSNGKADPKRNVEYQDWTLSCPDLPRPGPNEIVGQFIGMVVGLKCTIVGKRQAQAMPGTTAEPPHDNTFYGITPPPPALAQGHDNTWVGATDTNGNAIIKTDTVIGSHACGGPSSVVIGSHAAYGACNQ
jgi:hypothetical protein